MKDKHNLNNTMPVGSMVQDMTENQGNSVEGKMVMEPEEGPISGCGEPKAVGGNINLEAYQAYYNTQEATDQK